MELALLMSPDRKVPAPSDHKSPRSASFSAIGVNCDLYLATVTAELYYSGWAPKRRVRLTQAAEKCFWANPDYLAAASISPDSGFSNPREHLICNDRALALVSVPGWPIKGFPQTLWPLRYCFPAEC